MSLYPHIKQTFAGNCLASADGLEGLRPCGSLATLDLARNRLAELAALPAALDAALRSLCLVGNPLVPALRCAPAAALRARVEPARGAPAERPGTDVLIALRRLAVTKRCPTEPE